MSDGQEKPVILENLCKLITPENVEKYVHGYLHAYKDGHLISVKLGQDYGVRGKEYAATFYATVLGAANRAQDELKHNLCYIRLESKTPDDGPIIITDNQKITNSPESFAVIVFEKDTPNETLEKLLNSLKQAD